MRIRLYGKNAKTLTDLANQFGFEEVEENPDLIVSYGGDGTLLSAERLYPGIAKLPIRDSKVCNKCANHTNEVLFELLAKNNLEFKELSKLETEFEGNKLHALNDIVLRNAAAFHAIRLKVFKNQSAITEEIIIGDGIVASTPFGSTGYYQSITRTTFEKDFMIAFNNTVKAVNPITFTIDDEIRIQIVRGPAHLTSDNNPEVLELIEANELVIRASKQIAKIYCPETLRCSNCVVKREYRLD